MKKQKTETIDLTHNWKAALSVYLAVIGTSKNEEAIKSAIKGLVQMSEIAQKYAELVKNGENEHFVRRDLLKTYIKK